MHTRWDSQGDEVGLRRLLQLAVNASINGILLTDPRQEDNPIVFVNPAFERITGYRAEEAVGRNCRFLNQPEDDQPQLENLRAALREQREWTGILRNYRKDGSAFWNELHLAPVRDEQGRLTHFIGVQDDISLRKREETERLRVSAEYEQIIRTLPNVVFRWFRGEDGRMYPAYVEGALAERHGVTLASIAGKALEEVFPPEFLETVAPAFERAFAGETVVFSSRIGDRTFSNVAMPAPSGTEIVGYVTDVTERDRAAEALRESEERYEVAIRGSNDGIWDWDLDADRVYFSTRWKEMLGYAEDEVENDFDEWRRRVHPDDVEMVMGALGEYLDGRKRYYELEHRLLHKDGEYRWILTRGASVRDANGRVHRMAGSHTDITGRKALEEELRRQALFDPLTGLPNRTLLMERVENALDRTRREGGQVAVMFVDLDGFKGINDTLGHEAGDELLVVVANRLAECVRPQDTVARLGGDEFVALLENVEDHATAEGVAERITASLGDPITAGPTEISVRASIGVALGDHASTRAKDLLRRADGAMYRSKRDRPDRGTVTAGRQPARGRVNEDLAKAGSCSRCEALPRRLGGPGRLYLWLPLDHTLTKTYRHLRDRGWNCETARDYALVVRLDDDQLTALLEDVGCVLTGKERDDTRALFKPGGEGLTLSDVPRARSFSQLASLGSSGWLLGMLSEERLTSHFQPIVRAENPANVYAQECLLRGIDEAGGIVAPGHIFDAARNAGMLFQTDLAARRTAIREAVRRGVEGRLFINFTPTSIYDPRFCLRSTVEAIDAAGMDHERVVFEVTETEETNDLDHLANIAGYYRDQGFKVALDDMGSGYSTLNMIHRLRPDFIKLDMQLIRGVDSDPYKAVIAQKVLEMASDLGVETIVEGIETRRELAWAREQGADYVQGFLIARPSAKPSLAPPGA